MNHSEITSFIKNELPRKLRNDLISLKIVKEADIECAAYFHLRKLIGERSDWRILARKHVRATGHYIDLLLFNKGIPTIAIELKWFKKEMPPKDRQSLERAINLLKVQKAYWITVTLDEEAATPDRQHNDRNKLFQIIIPLGLPKEEKRAWIGERRKFKDKIESGKRISTPIKHEDIKP